MDITFTQIIYGVVFVFVLATVEGVYLLFLSNDGGRRAVNRRMELSQKRNEDIMNPSLLRKQVVGGAISQRIISIMPKLEQMFWVANIKMTPAVGLLISSSIAVIVFFGMRFVLLMPVAIAFAGAAVLGFGVPMLVLNFLVDRQRKMFGDQLPDAINLITRGLQAGHPVPVAFGLVAREMPDPIGGQFGSVIDDINFGRDRDVSLREVSNRFPNPDFKFFLAAVEMQRETGGNLVTVLDNLTKIVRERSNMKRKIWAVSSEGRLTCIIVGSLPYLLMGFLLLTNPSFVLDVVDDPMFWPLMGGAWGLWLFGIIWIWRMVNIKV